MRRRGLLSTLAVVVLVGLFVAGTVGASAVGGVHNCKPAWKCPGTSSTIATTTDPPPTTTAPPPTSEPAPIAGLGWHVVYEDNFDTFDPTKYQKFPWQGAWPAGSVYAQNGLLNIVSKRVNNYPTIDVVSKPGFSAAPPFYVEARVLATGGNGHWPAVWTLNKAHVDVPGSVCRINEFDVWEGQGSLPTWMLGALHYSTFTQNPCVPDQVRPSSGTVANTGVDLFQSWHTFSGLQTTTQASWYLDEQQQNSVPTWADSSNQPVYFILTSQAAKTSCPWAWLGCQVVDSSTPDELFTKVDYLRIWAP